MQKIIDVYSNNPHIFYNTFLLLGNLYVEYGMLKKGHDLFDKIIDNVKLNNKDKEKENKQLYDVVLCANYNSGLINFVIDKYGTAKEKFENALKIKREYLKEKNNLQISKIYETLAEIDIEYKNYDFAFVNLQKAIESRELSNTTDNEFRLKVQELRNYIEQYLTENKTEIRQTHLKKE